MFQHLTSHHFWSFQKRYLALSYSSQFNPRVFFTIHIDGEKVGNLTFELYHNHCPKTAENFKQLCNGENKRKLTYKGNVFHRIIPNFMAQGGDITLGNGRGGMSIYGKAFPDENLKLKHYKRGQLSMANCGPNTNGSQFFITFTATPWLDGHHCVFGEMREGEAVLKQIEEAGTNMGEPTKEIKIGECGEINTKI